MILRTPSITAGAVLAASLALTNGASAQNVTWGNSATNFNANNSWVGNVAPGSGNIAVFSSATASSQPKLSANITVGGLAFSSTGNWTFVGTSGGSVELLSIGSSGITNNGGTQTFNDSNLAITLAADTAFTANSGNLTFGSSLSSFSLNNHTLTLQGTSTNTGNSITEPIQGTGNIVKLGTGTWTISGAGNYVGTTTIGSANGADAGILAMGVNAALGNAAVNNSIVVYGGVLSMGNRTQTIGNLTLGGGASGSTANISGTGTLTLGGNVTYNAANNPNGAVIGANVNLGGANRTFNIGDSSAAANDLTINGVVSGTGGIIKTGTGNLVLNATTNSYSGNTVIGGANATTGGTLTLGGSGALGNTTYALTVYGGTFAMGANNDTVGSLNLGGGASGTNANITGTGTLTLGGNVTYDATNNPNGASVAANLALGAANRTFNIGDSSAAANDLAISGNITGSAGIIKTGAGNLVLSGNNTYSGNTVIGGANATSGGTLTLGASGALGNTTYALTVYGGTFAMGANNDTVGSLNLGGGASGTNANITGSGTLTLGGNVTYSAANNPNGASVGANIDLGGANRTFNIGDSSAAANDLTLSGNITGTGGIIKTGAGNLVLGSGSNTYSGNTVIGGANATTGGTLTLGASSALGNTAYALTIYGGTLDMGANNDTVAALNLGGGASGTNANITGAGTLTLGGNVTYSATNNPNGASVAANLALGSANRTFNVGDSAAAANDLTVSGNITGTGGVIKTGAGTLVASGSNTYTGNTTITQGTLSTSSVVVSSGASGLGNATAAVVLGNATSSGTLSYTGNSATFTRGLTVNAGGGGLDVATAGQTLTLSSAGVATAGNFTVSGAGNTTINPVISGAGNVIKTGAGTLTVNSNNTYTGVTKITQGTLSTDSVLVSGGASGLGNATSAIVLGDASSAGTLSYTGNSSTLTRGLTVNAGGGQLDVTTAGQTLLLFVGNVSTAGNFTVGGAGNTTISSAITGTGSLIKTGAGALTLGGNLTYTGNTAINQGDLIVNTASTVTLGSVTANLSGSGNLTKTGTGTLNLAGNSTGYGGNITVSQGTLGLSGGITLGSTANVSQGNVTSLMGTVNLTLAANTTLNNVSGTNYLSGNVTLTGNATINSTAGLLTVGPDAPSSRNPTNEPVDNGYITIGGQTLTFSGAGNVLVNDRIRDFAGQTVRSEWSGTTAIASPETSNRGNVVVNMTNANNTVTYYAAANSYTGNTTVQNGTLILDTFGNSGAPHDNTTPSIHAINGNLIIGDGTGATASAVVQLGSSGSANEIIASTSNVTLYKDGQLFLNNQGQSINTLTFGDANDATKGAGVVKTGIGTLYLNGNVVVNASSTGALIGNVGDTSGHLSLRLQPTAGVDPVADPTRTFTVASGGNQYDLSVYSIVERGDLVKAGNGVMMMNNANTYTGFTEVQGGILNVQRGTDGNSDSALGAGLAGGAGSTAEGTFVNVTYNKTNDTYSANGNSGTLQLQGNIAITSEKLFLNGTGFGNIGALNNLSGDNTWGATGNTTIHLVGNSLIATSGGNLTLPTTISSENENALTFQTAANTTITMSGSINTGNTGNSTVTKTGTGTLILSGSSSFQGQANITAGVVSLQHNSGLGAGTSGTNGTFVQSGAELQLSKASDLNISSSESLQINGYGFTGNNGVSGSGALHNVLGNNTFGGQVSLAGDSAIKSDSGTTLTLGSGISNSDSTHRALTIGGTGNTTVNGAVSIGSVTTANLTYGSSTTGATVSNTTIPYLTAAGSGGTLNKIDSGTLTFGGGATSTIDSITLTGGNITVNSGTTVHSGAFGSGANTTANTTNLTVNGTMRSYYASGSTTFNGNLLGNGTFQKDGAGTLVFNDSFTSNIDVTLTGGVLQFLNSTTTIDDLTLIGGTLQVVNSAINVDVLTLAGGTLALSSLGNLTANTIYITANTTLDFGGSPGGTFLSSANLVIAAGVTVTVNNWISTANDTANSTIWYLRSGPGTGGTLVGNATGNIALGTPDRFGGVPLDQIFFTNYGGMTTTWVSAGTTNGWFNHEIRPTPEPSTYGLIFLGGCLSFVGWRRFRRPAAGSTR